MSEWAEIEKMSKDLEKLLKEGDNGGSKKRAKRNNSSNT